MGKNDDLDGTIGSRDLITEMSRGLRFIPGHAWQPDDDIPSSKPTIPEWDPLVSTLKLDDDFWAEVEREAAKRRVNEPTQAEADSASDTGSVGSPAGARKSASTVITSSDHRPWAEIRLTASPKRIASRAKMTRESGCTR